MIITYSDSFTFYVKGLADAIAGYSCLNVFPLSKVKETTNVHHELPDVVTNQGNSFLGSRGHQDFVPFNDLKPGAGVGPSRAFIDSLSTETRPRLHFFSLRQ